MAVRLWQVATAVSLFRPGVGSISGSLCPLPNCRTPTERSNFTLQQWCSETATVASLPLLRLLYRPPGQCRIRRHLPRRVRYLVSRRISLRRLLPIWTLLDATRIPDFSGCKIAIGCLCLHGRHTMLFLPHLLHWIHVRSDLCAYDQYRH